VSTQKKAEVAPISMQAQRKSAQTCVFLAKVKAETNSAKHLILLLLFVYVIEVSNTDPALVCKSIQIPMPIMELVIVGVA
jgi:hypothetical protein